MIIWQGLGILVAVVCLGGLAVTEKVFEGMTGDDYFYQDHGWVKLIGMLFVAALTYGLHKLLLLQKGQLVIDKETGEEIVLRPTHSLFFIPVKWWPVAFVVLGLVLAAAGPQRGAQPEAAANGAGQFAQSENANAR
jgi:hypothetical protein